MKFSKVTSFVLTICMLIGMLCVPTVGLAANEVYKASAAWDNTLSDGATSWSYNGQPWKWQRKDCGNDWAGFVKYVKEMVFFGMEVGKDLTDYANRGTVVDGGVSAADSFKAPAVTAASYTGTQTTLPAVGEGWMRPYLGAKDENKLDVYESHSVARVFTAPKDGYVTITAEGDYIYDGSAKPLDGGTKPAFVRITRNGETIWPLNSDSEYGIRIPAETQKLKFDAVDVLLYKGDVVRFEVINGDTATQWSKLTWWQPVVTYNDTVVDTSKTYNSRTSLEAALNAAEVEESKTYQVDENRKKAVGAALAKAYNSWMFMNRNTLETANETTFTTFVAANDDRAHLLGLPKSGDTFNYNYKGTSGTDKVLSMFATNTTDNQNTKNAMSLDWMRTTHESNGKGYAVDSFAKVFIAPVSGKIQISAIDADGNAKIYGKRIASKEKSGPQLFIEKTANDGEPTLVKDNSEYYHKFTFDTVSSAVTEAIAIDFAPITMDVTEGEKIWFIMNNGDEVGGNTKVVHWNPVVKYYEYSPFELNAAASDVIIKKADNSTVVESFAETSSENTLNISVSANLVNLLSIESGVTKSAVACAAIYDDAGMLSGVGISEIKNITNASNKVLEFAIEVTNKLKPTAGSIKVFIFDSMSNIYPLCNLGNTAVLQ